MHTDSVFYNTLELVRDGYHLRCLLEGQGTPTFVIGSHIYYPRTFSSHLREHLHLAFVDHRGYAETHDQHPPEHLELSRVLEDMEAFRQALGWKDMVLVGHSGHAYMALEYAKKHPERVSHLVLIAAGPSQSPEFEPIKERYFQEHASEERKMLQQKAFEGIEEAIAAHPERRFVTYCLAMGPRSWMDPHYDAAWLWQDLPVNMDVMDLLWGATFRDIQTTRGLDRFQKPTLIVMGKEDYLVAPYFTWEPVLPEFADVTLKVMDHSGHTPQLEEPEHFDAVLLAWLNTRK
ncbi:alpha/beta fold hydrolase [Deinococcus cellulosilyticus]|uniref:AB hydrolase superfamily protein YclE n=1 Tax=Deinococcus cellulosilyticus (strain DSM 18568 / NBRC 106333 / KACC 11606 / 5516J-15) TaxID=1223518 RepID=A0A511N910_DEIC1|nr:alpha/beta hydrolase [Deinococcus cellulosilyticus]GEM49335.1 AB hydrolase superfamily protein YclE [Deinococcus cellulosilyticus NBRC 106333 = KACC 11606]